MIDCSEILIAFTVNPIFGAGGEFELTVMAGMVFLDTVCESISYLITFALMLQLSTMKYRLSKRSMDVYFTSLFYPTTWIYIC